MQKKTKTILLIFVSIIALSALFIYVLNDRKKNYIPNKLIAAIDQAIPDGGTCELYLADIFADMDWDTVTIFEPPYRKELNELLKIENREGQDGIVLSLDSQPINIHYSSYQHSPDQPAKISYSVFFTKTDAKNNYVSLSKELSYVKAKKYRYESQNGSSWKYVVYLYD